MKLAQQPSNPLRGCDARRCLGPLRVKLQGVCCSECKDPEAYLRACIVDLKCLTPGTYLDGLIVEAASQCQEDAAPGGVQAPWGVKVQGPFVRQLHTQVRPQLRLPAGGASQGSLHTLQPFMAAAQCVHLDKQWQLDPIQSPRSPCQQPARADTLAAALCLLSHSPSAACIMPADELCEQHIKMGGGIAALSVAEQF